MAIKKTSVATRSATKSKAPLKTVVVTGGGTGIGLATARTLLSDPQYRVVLLGRNRNHLESAARDLGGDEDRVAVSVCDLNDEKQITRAIEKLLLTHKSIYGLVNNAGVYPFGNLSTTSSESWDETLRVNLKAPFLLAQGLARAMTGHTDGGRIVNVSSTAGILPNHFALAYSVSKTALIALTRTLAKELGKDRITVNCVCPGIVRTALHEASHPSAAKMETWYQERGKAYPLGRVGDPQDVAGAIRYLLSPEASWVTGEVMVIDGGRLLT